MTREVLTAGEWIRRQRKTLGLTQAELAQQVKVNQSTVAKWERGDPPAIDNLESLGRALGWSRHDLIDLFFPAIGDAGKSPQSSMPSSSEDADQGSAPEQGKSICLEDLAEGDLGLAATEVRLSHTHQAALAALSAASGVPTEELVSRAIDIYLKSLVV